MPSQLLDRPGEELESDEVAVQMTIHEKAVRIQHGNCGTQESNAINTIGACMHKWRLSLTSSNPPWRQLQRLHHKGQQDRDSQRM
jgi:hypothetical protein